MILSTKHWKQFIKKMFFLQLQYHEIEYAYGIKQLSFMWYIHNVMVRFQTPSPLFQPPPSQPSHQFKEKSC